jgi:hypothetical protein
MKKIYAAAFLSLAVLGGSSGQAQAWGLCGSCRCCCYKYSVCCKPYNAFSPICYGKLYCDGCCPAPPPACPGAQGPHCMAGGCGCDAGTLGSLPPSAMHQGGPAFNGAPLPNGTAPAPTYTAPPPTPVDDSKPLPNAGDSAPSVQVYPNPLYYGMMQQAAYQPAYYGNYYPAPSYYPAYYPNYYGAYPGYYPANVPGYAGPLVPVGY